MRPERPSLPENQLQRRQLWRGRNVAAMAAVGAAALSCHGTVNPSVVPPVPPAQVVNPPVETPQLEQRVSVASVTLVAVGDVLPHRRVKASAAQHGWLDVFGEAVPVLRSADLAFANLETPIAPDHHQPLHGEVFDAPAALAPALAEAGIDVVSMANNHAFDQGQLGLVETWRRVGEAGVKTVGAGPDCAVATAPAVFEVGGVRVAFVAAADLSNIDGNTGPDAACLAVSGARCEQDCGQDRDAVPYQRDLARLGAIVAAARAQADFVVLSFHWGVEYDVVPLPEYPPLAEALTDAGVDVILGHHPHVLQPVVTRTTADGRTAVIAYSLGNFVSNMAEGYDPATSPVDTGRTRDGLALSVELRLRSDGVREVGTVRSIPLWTDNRADRITVRLVEVMARTEDPVLGGLARVRLAEIGRVVGSTVPVLNEVTD